MQSFAGGLRPSQLTAQHVATLNLYIGRFASASTRQCRSTAARRLLRALNTYHGAPPLFGAVARHTKSKPRNVTITTAEIEALLRVSKPHLECLILLCYSLAIRSGTAARLTPQSYDAERRTLTFRTKYQAAQVLPVTHRLAALLDRCDNATEPFVQQLWVGKNTAAQMHPAHSIREAFRRAKKDAGITRDLRLHDLRRTTVRRVYKQTRDLNLAQALLGHGDMGSTLWYLQGEITPITIDLLEEPFALNQTNEVIQ